MANKKYGVGIDLNYNELLKSRFENLTTTQRTALSLNTTHKGYVVFDTTENKPYWWNGSAWITTGDGGGATLAANVGNGHGFYKQKVGDTLQFKSIELGYGLQSYANADKVGVYIDESFEHLTGHKFFVHPYYTNGTRHFNNIASAISATAGIKGAIVEILPYTSTYLGIVSLNGSDNFTLYIHEGAVVETIEIDTTNQNNKGYTILGGGKIDTLRLGSQSYNYNAHNITINIHTINDLKIEYASWLHITANTINFLYINNDEVLDCFINCNAIWQAYIGERAERVHIKAKRVNGYIWITPRESQFYDIDYIAELQTYLNINAYGQAYLKAELIEGAQLGNTIHVKAAKIGTCIIGNGTDVIQGEICIEDCEFYRGAVIQANASGSNLPIYKVRFKHCYFTYEEQINLTVGGYSWAVIDSCRFINNSSIDPISNSGAISNYHSYSSYPSGATFLVDSSLVVDANVI